MPEMRLTRATATEKNNRVGVTHLPPARLGNEQDRHAAREWIREFFPQVKVKEVFISDTL
jgi:hypothetical protein